MIDCLSQQFMNNKIDLNDLQLSYTSLWPIQSNSNIMLNNLLDYSIILIIQGIMLILDKSCFFLQSASSLYFIMYMVQTSNVDSDFILKNSDNLFYISQMSVSSSTIGGGRTKFKIIFLGDQSVGKSSIIEKYIKDKFQEGLNPTIGIDFHIKNVTRSGRHFRIQLWDTAGQQRFRSLIPNYMKDAHCAVMVYDITRKASLQNIKIWNSMFQQHQMQDAIKVFVGNKADLQDERQVSKKEGQLEASKYKCKNFEVSAKQGKKLDQLFNCIIDMIVDHCQNGKSLPVVNEKVDKEQPQNQQPAKLRQTTEKFSLKQDTTFKSNKNKGCCKEV